MNLLEDMLLKKIERLMDKEPTTSNILHLEVLWLLAEEYEAQLLKDR